MAHNLDNYVDVSERIEKFYAKYPEGSLRCKRLELVEVDGAHFLLYVARAYRTADDPAPAEGAAWEPVPGKTNFTRDSELMNAETSAWGRAIAALGFEVKRDIASRQEVTNREAGQEASNARDAAAKSLKSHGIPAATQRDLVHGIAGDPPTIEGLQRVIEILESDGVADLFAAAGVATPEIVAKREEIKAAYDKLPAGSRKDLPQGKFTAQLKAEKVESLDLLAEKVAALSNGSDPAKAKAAK